MLPPHRQFGSIGKKQDDKADTEQHKLKWYGMAHEDTPHQDQRNHITDDRPSRKRSWEKGQHFISIFDAQ